MGSHSKLHEPTAAAAICAVAQVSVYPRDGDGADVTIADLAAEVLLAAGTMITFDGKAPIPAVFEDVVSLTIQRKACNTLNTSGDPVLIDNFNVNGVAHDVYTDDMEGGIDGSAVVNPPVGSCQVVTLCIEKCVTKEEFVALADA